MLEVTQEVLERIEPLLDAGDAERASKLLLAVDKTSLRALLIHVLHEYGSDTAATLGKAYLALQAKT